MSPAPAVPAAGPAPLAPAGRGWKMARVSLTHSGQNAAVVVWFFFFFLVNNGNFFFSVFPSSRAAPSEQKKKKRNLFR